MSLRVCVRVSVSVHADQVVTALTPSNVFPVSHAEVGGGTFKFDFTSSQGLWVVFNGGCV